MTNFKATYQQHTLVFKKAAGTSRGVLQRKETFFIWLAGRDDPSRVGIGECSPLPGLSLDGGPDFAARLAEVCERINQGDPVAELALAESPALAFGLECALLDWQGGGRRRLFDTDFSAGRAGLPTHGLIWPDDRAGLLRQVRAKVEQGFSCIKLKVGGLDFAEECRLLTDIRRLYPAEQVELRLDANGAFRPDNVLERLQSLAQFQIFALEQPLPPNQVAALAALSLASPIPIALDESLIGVHSAAAKRSLLKTIRPHYLVLKPSLIGGFAAAEEWINLARPLGIGWWVNSMLESNIGLNAICQWTSTFKPGLIHGLGSGRLFTNNIPGPLQLVGAELKYDPGRAWDLALIDGQPDP
jgi:o-succinylbenzoate synthase